MTELMWVLYSAGYLVYAVLMLLLAKKLFDLVTPYSLDVQLTEKDNPAIGLLLSGFLIGVAIVVCSALHGEAPILPTMKAFFGEVGDVVIYGAVGMVLLFIAGIINDKVILHKFSNQKEIVERRNSAVAVMMGMTYVGSGLIIGGSLHGGESILTVLVSFAIAQVALIIFAMIYQRLTRYDDQKELGEKMNVAAGIAFGGNILAFSLILMKGLAANRTAGETWTHLDLLMNTGYYALAGCVLLVIARLVTDHLFLPKARISNEIVRDRNLNAGYLEAALACSIGAVLVYCL